MKAWIALAAGVTAAAATGWAVTGDAALPRAAPAAATAAALASFAFPAPSPGDRTFPLQGRWMWVAGHRAFPARSVGCGAGEASLAILPHAVAVERDAWRLPAMTVVEWAADADGTLTLRLEDSGAEGRRRYRVRLDVSTPGFVRAVAVTDDKGRPAGSSGEALAEAFNLIRCAEPAVAVTAALRGTNDDTGVIR